jgi:hypothetical protein
MPSRVVAYKNRSPHVLQKVLTFDRHAAALLEEMAPTRLAQGAFLCQLIMAEAARREERKRLRAEATHV